MKLALGTAQFGFDYGLTNKIGKVNGSEVSRILDLCLSAGIDTLDTAIIYGDSEGELGAAGVSKWKVNTKLPPLPNENIDINNWIRSQISLSLQRLKISNLNGLLIHNPHDLFSASGPSILRVLDKLRGEGLIHKIGVSIYNPDELDNLLALYRFDLVQSPLNILDRRIIESGWAEYLHSNNIELHTRSVFLQGLLLMHPDCRSKKFNRWLPIWDAWKDWLEASKLTALEACLAYAFSHNSVDKVIVGVDDHNQLREILSSLKLLSIDPPNWPMPIEAKLINPSLWGQL